MVLLNGPVHNAWFCSMDRYRNVCVWFMARNCRFPKVGTLCCQRGNHNGTLGSQPGNQRLPLQATAGSQRLELTLPNLGTTGYHCKELPVPRGWNSWFPTWEPWVTIASNFKLIRKHFRYNFIVFLHNGPVQNAWFCLIDLYRNVCVWFMARNCRFPKVGTLCGQRGNHRLPLQGTAGSQRMELLVPNLGTRGCHCKQLPAPRGWNSRFPTWEPQATIARNCRFPVVGTLGSQPGTMGYHCKQLLK